MNKEVLKMIAELFELIKLQKEYSEILNKQIANLNEQIKSLRQKG
jgi:hypothetical protein